ncbi:MAG: CDP-alcohol phosphatidyltransferase family protein [Gemmatimonadaceae bacterium]|nr:CDP-alcohol phosphatidyltransferase family protein [Gemmatimonadaceae bacterium]
MPRELSTLFTPPNMLSASRVALAVAFLAADGTGTRVALLGAASCTDMLDGWLARRARWQTRFGALLDPVADRLFALAVLIRFLIGAELSLWQAGVLFFRDIMTLIGWFTARSVSWLRAIPFQARWLGKAVTVGQLGTFFVVLLAPSWVTACVLVVGALGVASTVDYTLMLWRRRDRVLYDAAHAATD